MKNSEKETSSVRKSKFRNDVILAAAILIVAAVGFLLINSTKSEGEKVIVKIDGVETESFFLSENIRFEIRTGENNENINVLIVENGKAYISEADCPDGICKQYRPVSCKGETIVCLPHRVVIEITGEATDKGLDIVA